MACPEWRNKTATELQADMPIVVEPIPDESVVQEFVTEFGKGVTEHGKVLQESLDRWLDNSQDCLKGDGLIPIIVEPESAPEQRLLLDKATAPVVQFDCSAWEHQAVPDSLLCGVPISKFDHLSQDYIRFLTSEFIIIPVRNSTGEIIGSADNLRIENGYPVVDMRLTKDVGKSKVYTVARELITDNDGDTFGERFTIHVTDKVEADLSSSPDPLADPLSRLVYECALAERVDDSTARKIAADVARNMTHVTWRYYRLATDDAIRIGLRKDQ